jgi:glucosamine--fructose-6-phosphate aminotransferase (isomerizing)
MVRTGAAISDQSMTSDLIPSDMARETRQAPDIVARLLSRARPKIAEIGRLMRATNPPVIVTCARGSSDHVAGYFKYCSEILAGVPVASIGPSVASLYRAPLRLRDNVLLAISQSGMSPDIVALAKAAKRGGARTIAIVNDEASDLAETADICLPIGAGAEKSVAATKTFIASAVAALAILAEWQGDEELREAIDGLPQILQNGLADDWSAAVSKVADADSLYVLGRGPAYPMAGEAALKFKETAGLHAEAHSGAEVMHGPISLVRDRFPVLVFAPNDAARPAMQAAAERMRQAGAEVLCVEDDASGPGSLRYVPSGHSLTDPISIITSFYLFVEAVSRARGHDPDNPRNLEKVTETV